MFSPEGTKIAFVSTRYSTDHPNEFDVYVVNTDGTGLTRLTYNEAWEGIVTWTRPKNE